MDWKYSITWTVKNNYLGYAIRPTGEKVKVEGLDKAQVKTDLENKVLEIESKIAEVETGTISIGGA